MFRYAKGSFGKNKIYIPTININIVTTAKTMSAQIEASVNFRLFISYFL